MGRYVIIYWSGNRIVTEDKQDIHTMREDHVRGGQVSLQRRLIECNDKSGICYIDANNLYGYAMSLPLPTGEHELLAREEIETKNWDEELNRDMDDCSYRYVFEIDLEYPKELHDEHDDLPFCAEKRKIKEEELSPFQKDLLGDEKFMTSVKLITTLYDKKKYMIHERYLKLALDNGLKLVYIHNVIRFNQAKVMKSYIDFNTQKRTQAKNDFEKDFFKLMNNAVYGKTLENMQNRVKMRVITDGDKMERYIRNPEFYGSILSNDDVAIVTERVKIAKLKTPVFIGGTVLDNSKHLMHDFKYRHGCQIFGEDMRITYMDTDSFIIKHNLSNEELEQKMKEHQELFDLSTYPTDHPLYSKENKKIIGKMKNEVAGTMIKEFCGLRPKCYAYRTTDNKVSKKSKGVKRKIVKEELSYQDYKDIVLNPKKRIFKDFNNIESIKHQVTTAKKRKLALSAFDDKHFILYDEIMLYS